MTVKSRLVYNLIMEQTEKKPADHGKILAKWNFPEFTKYERSKAWYLFMTLLVVLLLVYSVITVNFLFAVIIIIASITYLLIFRHNPEYVTFSITEDGLEDDERFFPFEAIKSFYIIYQPPEVKTLFFEFKSLIKPRLAIPLENQNPMEIRKILLKYLEEDIEKEDEPFSEGLGRMFKL